MAGALLQPLLLLLLSLALGSAAQIGADGERISSEYLCPRGAQPWQVALIMMFKSDCAGVLIDSSWVLTVAQCESNEYTVQMGSDILRSGNAQNIIATESFVHPEFNSTSQVHDIMLVKLSRPATLSSTVCTVDVPSSCIPDGTNCIVSGWGSRIMDREGNLAELLCTETSVFPIEECKEHSLNKPKEGVLCAGNPQYGSNLCEGNLGSPLMCEDSLQGLFSPEPFNCTLPLMPTSYTRVCAYHQWITDTMREHS